MLEIIIALKVIVKSQLFNAGKKHCSTLPAELSFLNDSWFQNKGDRSQMLKRPKELVTWVMTATPSCELNSSVVKT